MISHVFAWATRIQKQIVVLEVAAIAAIVGGLLVSDVRRIDRGNLGDFPHFFYAAKSLTLGLDPYAAHTRGYIYPPLLAFLFQPLAHLSIASAAAIMLMVNVTLTLISIQLASKEYVRRTGFASSLSLTMTVGLLAFVLNIDKVKGEWQMWQTDVLMLLLFVLALRWLDRLPIAAGIALGAAVNIKYLPIVFLPYLLVRRRWRVIAGLSVGTLAFAMLPAISTGWDNNLRNWQTASNGLLQMVNIHTQSSAAAEVHDVKDSLSCSITSSFARLAGPGKGFALAAGTAIMSVTLACWFYHRKGRSILSDQSPMLTGVEWAMLVAAVLAFGPQTNTRHLFDVLIVTAAIAALLLLAKPSVSRWPLLIGTAILFLGFILPPGNRTVIGERNPTVLWIRMGGPCWCLLIGAMTMLWTALEETPQSHRISDS